MEIRKNRSICMLIAIMMLGLVPGSSTAAASKKTTTIHIPVEVIDSLKESDIDGAIRNMRLEAVSPRSEYLLRQMQRIDKYEKDGTRGSGQNHRHFFNIGVAYHNLYLFLKGYNIDNETFFKNALKYYKSASRTKSPSKKNNVLLTMAALYAAHGDEKKAEKLFKKVDQTLYENQFHKYESFALFYSARGDADNAIINLKSAYDISPEHTTFWLGISDDFVQIYNNEQFKALLEKWKVKPLNRGPQSFSTRDKLVQ